MKDELMWEVFDKYNYLLHYFRYRKSKIYEKITGKGHWSMPHIVAGKWLWSAIKTNEEIGKAIMKGEPYWAGRFGGTEMNMIYQTLLYRMHPEKDNRYAALNKLCIYSGFFPCDISLGDKFVDLMLENCGQIDLQGQWRRYMEDYIYLKYQPNTKLSQLFHLEPWNMYKYPNSNIKPWSSALKGKRVLVIHPFEDSIRKQYYENRDHIFERIFKSEDILPEFELITLKAVQTISGEIDVRFKTWFDALEWMMEKCRKINFDVAIIGCGAYGYPLAAEIKKMGKIAIHLGGATQILFGIKGRRWEADTGQKFYKHVVNEFWIRPSEKEMVNKAEQIENGCYW